MLVEPDRTKEGHERNIVLSGPALQHGTVQAFERFWRLHKQCQALFPAPAGSALYTVGIVPELCTIVFSL